MKQNTEPEQIIINHYQKIMKQYIALIDNKQIGPNTIKELIALGLTGDTYVWNPDLANWIRASETEDFKSTFAKKSPMKFLQLSHAMMLNQIKQNPRTWRKFRIQLQKGNGGTYLFHI